MRGILIALAAALLSAAALLTGVRELARGEARRSLEAAFAPRIWIGDLRLDVLPGRLRISPLTLLERRTDLLLARVERLVADLGVGWRGPRIERLRLLRPEVFRWRTFLRPDAASGEGIPMLSIEDGSLGLPSGDGKEIRLERIQLDLRRIAGGGIRGPGSLRFAGGSLRFVATVDARGAEASGSADFSGTAAPEIASFDPRDELRFDARVADRSLDLAFRGPTFSARIPGTRVRVSDPRGRARFSEASRDLDLLAGLSGGTVRLNASLARADSRSTALAFRCEGLSLGPDLASLGALDPIVRDLAEGLRPAGRVDLQGRLSFEAGGPVSVEGDGVVGELALSVEGFSGIEGGERIGFPLPAHIRRGLLSVSSDRIWIHDVQGEMGGGSLTFSGEVFDLGFPGLDLDARVAGMRIGSEVREALARVPGAQEVFDSLEPAGTADVAVRITRPAGVRPVRASVRIEPRDATVRWKGFPVRIEGLEGNIEIEPERIRFRLRGRACGGDLEVLGDWTGTRGEEDPLPGVVLEVRARGLEPTGEFLEALRAFAPETEVLERGGGASGPFDLEVNAFRARGATDPELALRARARLRGVSVPIPGIPFVAREVRGDVLVTRRPGHTAVVVEGARGTVDAGRVAPAFASLDHHHSVEQTTTTLEMRALSLPLDDDFVAALQASGPPGIPADLSLSGEIDVEVLTRRGSGPNDDRATVRLRSVDIRSTEPRIAFEGLEGSLEAGPTGLRAERLTARWAGAPVLLEDVEVVPGERKTIVSFLLHAEGVPLREEAWSDLPAGAADVLRSLALHGEADLLATRVTLELAEETAPAVSVEGTIRLRSLSVGAGLSLRDVEGVARISGLRIDAAGVAGQGTLEATRASALGRTLEGLSAEFELLGAELRVPRFSTQLAGGIWTEGEGEALRLRFDPSPRIELSIAFSEVDLGRLLAESIPRSGGLAGRLSGGLRLSGPPSDLAGFEGEGAVSIEDGALGSIPVFRNLYEFLQVGTTPVFRSGFFRFVLGERRVRFEEVELSSPLLEIRARGTLGLDGELDIRLDSSLFPILPDLVLVTDLWRLFKRQFVSFRLHGPIENPKIRVENLLRGVLGPPPRVSRLPYLPPAIPPPSRRPPWF